MEDSASEKRKKIGENENKGSKEDKIKRNEVMIWTIKAGRVLVIMKKRNKLYFSWNAHNIIHNYN